MSEALDLFRFFFALYFLTLASISDIKTRKVSDKVWVIMGIAGLAVLEAQLLDAGLGWEY